MIVLAGMSQGKRFHSGADTGCAFAFCRGEKSHNCHNKLGVILPVSIPSSSKASTTPI